MTEPDQGHPAEAIAPVAAGLVLRAEDTGRVLMIQRALDPSDPASGTFEFPGGRIEDGESALDAARREWSEETGLTLPADAEQVATWDSEDGVYTGFVFAVPVESEVPINPADGRVLNPDDPDGDMIEVCCWFDVSDLPGMPSLRRECRDTPWEVIVGEAAKPITAAGDMTAVELPATWEGCLAPLDTESGDGRSLAVEGYDTRPLPLPHGWQRELSEGHDGACRVASIAFAEVRNDGAFDTEGPYIYANGPIDLGSDEGAEWARRLVEYGHMPVSVDLDDMAIELRYPDGTPVEQEDPLIMLASGASNAPAWRMALGTFDIGDAVPEGQDPEGIVAYATAYRVMGVTAVDHPAFYQAKVVAMAAPAAVEPAPVVPSQAMAADPMPPVAPADGTPQVGDKVNLTREDGEQVPGVVSAVNDDGTLDVDYTDTVTVRADAVMPADANPAALTMTAGAFAVLGSTDLPVAARDAAWDGPGALDRVFAWASDDKGVIDVSKVGQAFLYRADDADPSLKGSYSLGFADIMDGALTIIPLGAAACTGGHGIDAVQGVPADQREAMQTRICSIYDTIRKTYDDWPDCPYAPGMASLLAAAPTVAPMEFFSDPGFDGPQDGMIVTPEGRIMGHLAHWDTCHTGYPGACVTPPHSMSEYAYFHTGTVETADGSRVAVGQITVATGHAAANGLSWRAALAHYDNTGACAADIRVGEDEYGIWYSGVLRAGLSEAHLAELRASGRLSGDWRKIGGYHELVGALAVNVGGFPIPRTTAAIVDGEQTALVAAGIPGQRAPVKVKSLSEMTAPEAARAIFAEQRAIERRDRYRQEMAARLGRDPETLAAARVSRITELADRLHSTV